MNYRNIDFDEFHPRKAWMDVPTDFEIIDWISSMHGMDPRVDQGRHLPTAAGICRRRGGSGCGGVSAMDGATELTGTYLQRPPQPDPPRHPAGNQLLLLLLQLLCCCPGLKASAGAGTQPGRPTPSAHVNAYSIFRKGSFARHVAAILRSNMRRRVGRAKNRPAHRLDRSKTTSRWPGSWGAGQDVPRHVPGARCICRAKARSASRIRSIQVSASVSHRINPGERERWQ